MKIPEFMGLLISWLVISLCFSISTLFTFPNDFYLYFIIAAASAGVGFLLHELAHRSVAKHYGCNAYYQVWPWGIVLALVLTILSRGGLIFAALGAVYISPMMTSSGMDYKALKKIFGYISLAGPSMNLVLVPVFYMLQFTGGIFFYVGNFGLIINLWLAAFNLIPIPPFDGSKIFAWSKTVWALFAIPTWLLLIAL